MFEVGYVVVVVCGGVECEFLEFVDVEFFVLVVVVVLVYGVG